MKFANKTKLDAKSIKTTKKEYIKKLNALIKQIVRNDADDIKYIIKLLFLKKPKSYSFWVNRKRKICLNAINKSQRLKERICDYYGFNYDETYFGNIDSNKIKDDVFPYSTVFGDVIFIGSSTINCDRLTHVFGDVNFSFSAIHKLNIKYIYGTARFFHANMKYLNKLCYVGGDLDIRNSNICSLPELEIVLGTAYIYNTEVKNIPSLITCGRLVKEYSQLIDTESFKS